MQFHLMISALWRVTGFHQKKHSEQNFFMRRTFLEISKPGQQAKSLS